MTTERWQPTGIGLYEVSDHGNVRGPRGKISTRVINGFKVANIKKSTFTIHRFVAKAFIPNPNGWSFVRHHDGNKFNNYYTNLAWHYSSRRPHDHICTRCGEQRNENDFELKRNKQYRNGALKIYTYRRRQCNKCIGKVKTINTKRRIFNEIHRQFQKSV